MANDAPQSGELFDRVCGGPQPAFDSRHSTDRLSLLSVGSMQDLLEQSGRTQFKERVYGLIGQLDSDSFRQREEAQANLLGMDRSILPMLALELNNPRSAESEARARMIYNEVGGVNQIQFNGDTGRDGAGRLREMRDNLSVEYVPKGAPGPDNAVSSIHYHQGNWDVQRQADGTYTIAQDGNEFESGVRMTLNQQTGVARMVLRDGSPFVVPPQGPRFWYREGSGAKEQ